MSLYKESVPTPSILANKSNKTDKWHGTTVRKML